MREKLETLSLAALRDIAKNKQIKNISAMRKKELIDAILETVSDEENNKTAEQTPALQENTKENPPAQAQGQTKQTSGGTNMASIGEEPYRQDYDPAMVDRTSKADGILEVMPDGYGFIRCANYLPGDNDIYVSPVQIRKFGLKTGDIIVGAKRIKNQGEKFSALLYMESVNGYKPSDIPKRTPFEKLTPIFLMREYTLNSHQAVPQ